jgi:hypothetical protein
MHTRNFDANFIGLYAVHYSWCLIGLMVTHFFYKYVRFHTAFGNLWLM